MARPTRVIAKHVVATDAISAPWFATCMSSTADALVATPRTSFCTRALVIGTVAAARAGETACTLRSKNTPKDTRSVRARFCLSTAPILRVVTPERPRINLTRLLARVIQWIGLPRPRPDHIARPRPARPPPPTTDRARGRNDLSPITSPPHPPRLARDRSFARARSFDHRSRRSSRSRRARSNRSRLSTHRAVRFAATRTEATLGANAVVRTIADISWAVAWACAGARARSRSRPERCVRMRMGFRLWASRPRRRRRRPAPPRARVDRGRAPEDVGTARGRAISGRGDGTRCDAKER